jgi:hypothetical protein
MPLITFRTRFISALLVLLIVSAVPGAVLALETQSVFEQFSDRVIKIRVVEKGTGVKAVMGSGFFVSHKGEIVTNYHVISKLIHYPDRYRAEFVDRSDAAHHIRILAVDVVNDLAIVKADHTTGDYFRLAPVAVEQGTRLYSLGFPHDIGITIVEGTYNGFMEHAYYKKIHCTSSINPGMSGGPTITASGKVVGINVSSAGNQVSFLVPVDASLRLLNTVSSNDKDMPESLLETVRMQLLEHQEAYFDDEFIASGPTVQLGSYELPGKIAPFFDCWADARHREKDPYKVVNHQCLSHDYIYVSGDQRLQVITFRHKLITTDTLNPFRFYSLYSYYFGRGYGQYGSEEDVTKYRCESDTVRSRSIPFKTVFCVRGYRKMEGLYDVVFKAAALGKTETGLETTLELSGISFEKAAVLARHYLEAISWRE